MATRFIREAIGVFQDFPSLQRATDALLTAGFDRAELSLLADPRTVREKLGRAITDVRAFEDLPDVPVRPYAGIDSRIEAEGALIGVGAYAAAIVAAIAAVGNGLATGPVIAWVVAAGLGGAGLGAIFAGRLEGGYRRYVRGMIAAGGLLLWVRARDAAREARALDILRQFGASDVHAHDVPARVFRPGEGVSRELAWLNKPFFRALTQR